jgi:hypothetical protein
MHHYYYYCSAKAVHSIVLLKYSIHGTPSPFFNFLFTITQAARSAKICIPGQGSVMARVMPQRPWRGVQRTSTTTSDQQEEEGVIYDSLTYAFMVGHGDVHDCTFDDLLARHSVPYRLATPADAFESIVVISVCFVPSAARKAGFSDLAQYVTLHCVSI